MLVGGVRVRRKSQSGWEWEVLHAGETRWIVIKTPKVKVEKLNAQSQDASGKASCEAVSVSHQKS